MQLSNLDLSKMYTYADYLKWQLDERVELIRGKVFRMSPAPNYEHQRISSDLHGFIWSHLRDKECKVFSAPFDVLLTIKSKENEMINTVLQPDICVICDMSKKDIRGCVGAPEIVVEILSPGNNAKELITKYEVYEQAGVKEYWVVSPTTQTFIINTLVDGKYRPSRQMTIGDTITSTVLPSFSLNLADLFVQEENE
jgi:Uma2 family endonuclease